MSKAGMKCPFSKGACIECGIFRGRHNGLCFTNKYTIRSEILDGKKTYAARPNDTKWEVPPEFEVPSGVLKDIEETVLLGIR